MACVIVETTERIRLVLHKLPFNFLWVDYALFLTFLYFFSFIIEKFLLLCYNVFVKSAWFACCMGAFTLKKQKIISKGVEMNLLVSSAGTIVDIALIVIILIFAIVGCVKGFVKSFLATFGWLFALIFAVLLCSAVTNFLENKFGLVSSISGGVGNFLTGIFGDKIMNTTLREATEEVLNGSSLSGWLISIVLDVKELEGVPMDVTVNQIISPVFGYYATCVISIVGLFILFRIVFFIIGELMKFLHKIKLIGFVDRLLGFLFGVIRGFIFVQIIMIIIRFIPMGFLQQIVTYLDASGFATFIQKINLFSVMLSALSQVNLLDMIKTLIIK